MSPHITTNQHERLELHMFPPLWSHLLRQLLAMPLWHHLKQCQPAMGGPCGWWFLGFQVEHTTTPTKTRMNLDITLCWQTPRTNKTASASTPVVSVKHAEPVCENYPWKHGLLPDGALETRGPCSCLQHSTAQIAR